MGHVPRFLSKITSSLLEAGGKVEATVTGTRQNKRKNGLQVPCNCIRPWRGNRVHCWPFYSIINATHKFTPRLTPFRKG